MKLRCPNCGHGAGLLDFANEEAARQTVLLVADLPKSLGRLSLRYIGLFKPTQNSLSWERSLKLLQSLKHDIDRAQIDRHGRIWPAPESHWVQAFNLVIEKAEAKTLKLPLKNHAYLYEIISSQQNAAEAHAEQAIEKKRQAVRERPAKKAQPVADDVDKQIGEQAMNQIFQTLGRKRPKDKGLTHDGT
ncbi:MAG: hypothetical protein AB7D03_03710 [Thiomicrospira sp.]